MSFFDFNYDAYRQQLHGMNDDASAANSDTEADHHPGSSPSDTRRMSAVLEGLRGLGIEHRRRPADDGPQIGRSSFAGSTRMDRRLRRDDMFHSTRHNPVSLWRADAPGPRDVPEHQTIPEHVDAQVTRHTAEEQTGTGGSSAAAPRRRRGLLAQARRALGRMVGASSSAQGASSSAQGANSAAGRRRAREGAQEFQPRARYIAGSLMQAEETALPPPAPATHSVPYSEDLTFIVRATGVPYLEDLTLIVRAIDGLVASEAKDKTGGEIVRALIAFSAWLRQIRRTSIHERLFDEDLKVDGWSFTRLGGNPYINSALDHLRNIESSTHGTTQITTREHRRDKAALEADRLLVDLAFGDAPVSQAVPSARISTDAGYRNAMLSFSEWLGSMDHPGLASSNALHSDLMTNLARQYAGMGLPYGRKVIAALAQLRHFDLAGTTNVKRQRNTLNIPEADQRLVERYLAQANEDLENELRETGRSARDQAGYTRYDRYAVHVRSFSSWLQGEGRRDIASRLYADSSSLEADLARFHNRDKKKDSLVRQIRAALDHMRDMFSSEFAMARIGPDRFVGEQATQHMGQVPTQTPSPYHLSPMSPSAFPSFSGRDAPSQHAQPSGRSGSVQPGTDSIYGGLGSLGSAAHYGSYGAPQEVTRQPHAASPFLDLSLSSLNSAAHYGSPGGSYPSTPSEVASTSQRRQPRQAGTDSIYAGLSPLGSAAYPSTPSEVAGPSQPRQPEQARQPLPFGPLAGSLRRVLSQLNYERGFASGDSLNCLIDAALQLSTGVRRLDYGQTPMPDLDGAVPQWRQHLSAAGVVPRHEMIDLYSAAHAGQDLADNLRVRIQIIQWENGRATAHPVLGQHGPLLHILHTPGHFQPLWPRNV